MRTATPQRFVRLLCCITATLGLAAAIAAPATANAAPATPAPAQAAPGGIGLRLIDAPVAAREDPRARVYIVDHLAPGTVIERRIEVSNTTANTEHITLYAAAASLEEGSFVGAPRDAANELSGWTSIDPSEVDVHAGATLTATVTITVPPDAAPGEQYAAVWAEARSADAASGVTQVSRVGIRLYVSVGPGGPPAGDFTIDSLTAARSPDGQPMILATVHNTGGRALDINGTLQLSAGPGGLSAGPFPAQLSSTLAIDATHPITMALDDQLPAGPWEAHITLSSGLLERNATATLTFPDSGASAPVDAETPPGWLYPAIISLLALVLLAIAAAVVGRRRRRRRLRGDQLVAEEAEHPLELTRPER